MGFYRVEALILRAREAREADQVLTLLTREKGKIAAVARGVRKPQSKLRGGVQVFSHSDLMLHSGRTLDRVTGAEARRFFNFHGQWEKLAYAVYWADLLERALPEAEPQESVFELTLGAFRCLEALSSESRQAGVLSLFFEWRLIILLGYRPCLEQCAGCGSALDGALRYPVSIARGGTVCPLCAHADQDREGLRYISAGTLRVLQRWAALSMDRLWRLALTASNRREMRALLDSFFLYYLEQEIPSRRFLPLDGDWWD